MEKICAVIVTYNRPELLCRCVEHLLRRSLLLWIVSLTQQEIMMSQMQNLHLQQMEITGRLAMVPIILIFPVPEIIWEQRRT